MQNKTIFLICLILFITIVYLTIKTNNIYPTRSQIVINTDDDDDDE